MEGREAVNHPKHYNTGSMECIDAIEAAVSGKWPQDAFLIGNILKYLWRYDLKDGVQDLKKAAWYLDRLIGIVGRRYGAEGTE